MSTTINPKQKKRVVPMTTTSIDRRIVPMTIGNNHVVPLTTGDRRIIPLMTDALTCASDNAGILEID